MVRLSIYNEKGGVGKTTITAMLASYLSYVHGKSVCVLDFDYPSYHFMELRQSELRIAENPKSPLAIWLRNNPSQGNPFNIVRFPIGDGGVYRPGEVFLHLRRILSAGHDYVFFDFPGRFAPGEPVSFLAANGFLDFVAIPMDTDSQSRRSALVVADAIQKAGIPLTLFWNRVSLYEAKGNGGRFRRGAEPFLSRGMDVMQESVRDIRIISRDPSELAFVRSTLCFPERYVNMRSESIVPFLEAIKRRIDNVQHTAL